MKVREARGRERGAAFLVVILVRCLCSLGGKLFCVFTIYHEDEVRCRIGSLRVEGVGIENYLPFALLSPTRAARDFKGLAVLGGEDSLASGDNSWSLFGES